MSTNGSKNCIIHVRVSSAKQAQQGESLDLQEHICRQIAKDRGWNIVPDNTAFREQYSWQNKSRPVFDEIIAYIKKHPGAVQYLIIRMIDRFTRSGAYTYQGMKMELAKHGVQLVDSYNVIQPTINTMEHTGFSYKWSNYAPSETAEIIIAHQGKIELTNILTRTISQEIKLTQEGYKIRRANDGYKNTKITVDGKKKVIQEPDPERAHYFRKMFELRASGQYRDEEIVTTLNAMGFRTRRFDRWDARKTTVIGFSGEKPLSVKQLQRYIQAPIYAGIVCEKWTHNKAVQAKYDGLVSIDLFNLANRGKVVIRKDKGGVTILYDQYPEKRIDKRSRYNALFPYRHVVMCPQCGKPLLGSSPTGKSGKSYPTYHCGRGHSYFGINKETLENLFENAICNIFHDPGQAYALGQIFMEKYENRAKEYEAQQQEVQTHVSELRLKQQAMIDALIHTTSPTARKALDAQIETLETSIQQAENGIPDEDVTRKDIEWFTDQAKLVMEHLQDLLLKPEDIRVHQLITSLVYEEFPNPVELASGTPKMAFPFMPICGFGGSETQCVTPQSLHWKDVEDTIKKWKQVYATVSIDELINSKGGKYK